MPIRNFIERLLGGGPKPTPGVHTFKELAAKRHPVDDFFSSDWIEWIAVRTSPKAAASAWSKLMETKSLQRRVAERSPASNDLRSHWVVFRFAGSPWTQLRLVHGGGLLNDRHLRELSRRTGAEAVLLYGRNKYDECRALAAIYYAEGEPRETLLIGADEEQDLMLDHLELDDQEAGELSFDFEFDESRQLPKDFLARHGLGDDDLSGELERMDVLIG